MMRRPFLKTTQLLSCLALFAFFGMAHAREVRVGVYSNEPKIFHDAKGKPAGILIDLLQRTAAKNDWALNYVSCTWQECLDALQDGKIDLMPDVAYTPQREKFFDFHKTPALHSWSQVFSRKGISISSVPNLDGKRIAVLDGSIQADFFKEMAEGFGIKVVLIRARTYDEAFDLVTTGAADAVITNNQFGEWNALLHQLVETPIVFLPTQLYFVTNKGRHPDLLSAIDRQLDAWKTSENSEYVQILKKWHGATPTTGLPPYVWQALGVLLAALCSVIVIATFLRRQIKIKTYHLEAEKAQVNAILNALPDLLFETRADGCILSYHSHSTDLLAAPPEAFLGRRLHEVVPTGVLAVYQEAIREAMVKGVSIGKQYVLELAGSQRWFELSTARKKVEEGKDPHFISLARDITDRKQAERKIAQLAFFDQLTGLPNRTLLQDRIKQAMASSQRTGNYGALLLIDLDYFKTLNDTLGHDFGDLLLKQVAQRLIECVREEDTVARLGGDEFVVMLVNLSESLGEAASRVEMIGGKIGAALNKTFELKEATYRISMSIGASVFLGQQTDIDTLVKQADLAMYKAKDAGRNTLRFFDPEMAHDVQKRASLENDLHHAIQDKQFVVHYQAQIQGGQVTGAETLLRWRHPEHGLVSPGEFISVLEETGLVRPVGQWVLETACRQLADWAKQSEMSHLTVSVNISAHQLNHEDFVDQVLMALERSGADPGHLKLELTESLLVNNVEKTIGKMNTLKAQGVGFSLDDFGTGYSSLSYLKRLPLDQLKIDQSFVRDILTDPNDAAIAKMIVLLAESLGLAVIAEGVETEAQRALLANLGCHTYQGYLFSRPLPLEEFEAYTKSVIEAK